MLSLAACLLVAVAVVRFWPALVPGAASESPAVYAADAQVLFDEIQPTRQARDQAPPPPMLPPLVVPDDRTVLQEVRIDFINDLVFDAGSAQDGGPEGTDEEPVSAPVPAEPPRRLSIVEASYPREARRRDVRARVLVRVRVGSDGRVREARIVRRVLLEDDGERTVEALGYGLDRSALDAARRTLFIPARAAGEPVESWHTIPIGFGG